MKTDFDDLWERFSIMTVAGMSDAEALEYLKGVTTPELYQKLVDKAVFGL